MICLKRYFKKHFIKIYLSLFFSHSIGVNIIQSGSVTAILKANRWRHTGYVKITSNSHQNAAATEHRVLSVTAGSFSTTARDTADVPAFHSVAHALL